LTQSDLPPVDLSVGDIRSQLNCGRMVTDSATVTMESL